MQRPGDEISGPLGAVLRALILSTRSDEYRSWFLAVEGDGDFEKKATAGELEVSLAGMEESFLRLLAAMARDALDHDRFQVCDRAMQVLGAVGAGSDLAEPYVKGVADRVEDMLAARCVRLADAIYHGINWERKGWKKYIRVNRKFCRGIAPEVKKTVLPLMDRLTAYGHNAEERRRRVATPVTRLMRNLGLAWARATGYRPAKAAMTRAKQWADSRVLLDNINSEIQSIYDQRFKRTKGKGVNRWGAAVWSAIILSGVISGLFSGNKELPSNAPATTPDIFAHIPKYVPAQEEVEDQRLYMGPASQNSVPLTPPVDVYSRYREGDYLLMPKSELDFVKNFAEARAAYTRSKSSHRLSALNLVVTEPREAKDWIARVVAIRSEDSVVEGLKRTSI